MTLLEEQMNEMLKALEKMTIGNIIIVPPRLYELLSRCKFEAAAEVPDDQVLVVDKEGHVHLFQYGGRLIDMEGDVTLEENLNAEATADLLEGTRYFRLLRAAKLCRSYFFEDPNRAYEILADALREIEA